MLYSLLIAVIVLAISCPILTIFSFIKGYNLKAEKVGERPISTPSMPKKKPKGDRRTEMLLANIEAYDGTEKGQRKIDV